MTLAERWKAEGEAKGRIEDRQEGKRALLRDLLQLKFGELSPPILERLSAASEDELKAWTGRVLSAASITDVLGK